MTHAPDPHLPPDFFPEKLRWWTEARFGLSLHFGLYSIAARGEWVRSVERIPADTYAAYAAEFNPHPDWAKHWAAAARRAGARYAVLTTKHHDGFCLFDSALTDFKTTATAARRDLVREWVEAIRAEGLRVGLYYSLVDWHHPDYPATGDRQHPLRDHPDAPARDAACVWSRYLDYMHGQMIELCSHYGPLDLFIVDFSYHQYTGEKWGATAIQQKLRALQPHMLFNDRWAKEPRKQIPAPPFAGDFEQTEQNLPREGLKDHSGQPMPWEAWFTLTNSWSHNTTDHAWKSPQTILRALVNAVSKNGNLLLNASPDARGLLPERSLQTLDAIGAWLARNGDSIYGCGAAGLPKPEWGRWTRRGDRLYAHLLDDVIGHISLPGLRGQVSRPRLLDTGAEAILTGFWNPEVQTFDHPDDIFLNLAEPAAFTYPRPDSTDTVIQLNYHP